jgi:hypothetical protein
MLFKLAWTFVNAVAVASSAVAAAGATATLAERSAIGAFPTFGGYGVSFGSSVDVVT